MARTHYDYIIAGAGCAGLGLVWKLLRSPLRGKSILILDPDGKTSDDRTWCFWDSAIPDLPCPPSHSWQKISVHTDAGSHVHGIAPYHYHHLSGKEYYDSIHALLEDADQVDWRQEAVLGFESLPEGVTVTTTGGQYHAGWVFSSLPVPAREERSEESMFQHFLGYFIETERDVFDPAQVHLMDFRVTQEQDIRFFYLLPFSPGKALIEFTVFSDEVWEQDRYVPFLDAYLEQLSAAGSGAITITHQEQGVIPMNTRPEKIWRQPGVMNLGIAGGAARPGTGYAFQFIQERNQQIVDSLIRISVGIEETDDLLEDLAQALED